MLDRRIWAVGEGVGRRGRIWGGGIGICDRYVSGLLVLRVNWLCVRTCSAATASVAFALLPGAEIFVSMDLVPAGKKTVQDQAAPEWHL